MEAIGYDRVSEVADILNSPLKRDHVDFRKSRYPPPGTIGCGRKHTLLSFASMRASNTGILKLLLDASASQGIPPDEQANPDDLTPAYLACCWGHLEALRLLRAAGSEIDPKIDGHKEKEDKTAVGSSGNTSMAGSSNTSAVSSSNSSTAVSSNSGSSNEEPHHQHSENLFTPLMAASNFGHAHVVNQLLDWGVRVSYPTKVSSALALAVNQGRCDSAGSCPQPLLLELKTMALYLGHQKVVDSLVNSGRVDWKLEIKSALAHRASEFARRFYVLSKRHRVESNENLPPRTPITPTISTIKDKDIQQELTHLSSIGFLTECPVCFDHVGTKESDDHEIMGKNTLGNSNVIGNIVIHSCGRLFCEDCLTKMAGSGNFANSGQACPICRRSMNISGRNTTCLKLAASHRPALKGYLM